MHLECMHEGYNITARLHRRIAFLQSLASCSLPFWQEPSCAAVLNAHRCLTELVCHAVQSKSIWELQGKLHEVKRQRDALLMQLEGRPEKTMRSCEEIDESELLLAADGDISCWQQHELLSAEHGPSRGPLLFGH